MKILRVGAHLSWQTKGVINDLQEALAAPSAKLSLLASSQLTARVKRVFAPCDSTPLALRQSIGAIFQRVLALLKRCSRSLQMQSRRQGSRSAEICSHVAPRHPPSSRNGKHESLDAKNKTRLPIRAVNARLRASPECLPSHNPYLRIRLVFSFCILRWPAPGRSPSLMDYSDWKAIREIGDCFFFSVSYSNNFENWLGMTKSMLVVNL